MGNLKGHGSAWPNRSEYSSDNVTRSINRNVRLPQGFNHAIASPVTWPQINKQNLVQVMVNDFRKFGTTLNQFAGRKLTFKDAILNVIAPVSHRSVDFTESLGVADVITDDKGLSHDDRLADGGVRTIRGRKPRSGYTIWRVHGLQEIWA